MPLTPFHFGFGVACKAILPKHFSFSVFCFTQVVIDAEVIYAMLRGNFQLHGIFHTFLGSTFVAALCIIVGKPLCIWLKRMWNAKLDAQLKSFLTLPKGISRAAAFLGAFVGAYSHVLLDSFMHADVKPFAPISSINPMLGQLSFTQLHLLCVLTGVFGVILYSYRFCLKTKRTSV